jgi:hypothetical protein
MRLNFSNSSPRQIETGIKRLGELFSSRLQNRMFEVDGFGFIDINRRQY